MNRTLLLTAAAGLFSLGLLGVSRAADKDEKAGATLMLKAAQRGSPIAQNRVAHILADGRGLPANPGEAMKWHIIAKKDGRGDPELDAFMARQKQEDRTKAEVAATRWLASTRPNP